MVCSGAEAQSSGLDPVAPVIDLKTLLRLHNLVEGHTTLEERGSKRVALAYFVMDVTLPLPRKLPLDVSLAEAAGNAMDREVARYDTARKKAEKALRVSEGRAASKKRQREDAPAAEEAPAAPTGEPPGPRRLRSNSLQLRLQEHAAAPLACVLMRCHPSSRGSPPPTVVSLWNLKHRRAEASAL